jgi:hypothetical protein
MEVDITAEVDRLFDPSSVPGDGCPVAVILWGGIATGKTALRKQKFATGYVLLDAADIFLSLSRGEYFDFPDGLEEPMDTIGRLATRRALTERRSIVTEVVGAEAGPMQELLGALKSIGYRVEGVAVTCDLDESLRRNEERGDDDISSHYAGPYQQAWIVDACRELAEARANRRVVYVDMDGVLVDFQSGLDRVPEEVRREYEGREDDIPGIFALMDPMAGAVESFAELASRFDTYILSTAPWANPSAWSDKLEWVKRHLGDTPDSPAYKRLILTHHKDLNRGAFLIDDRPCKRGAEYFGGTVLSFGPKGEYPDWHAVMDRMRGVT